MEISNLHWECFRLANQEKRPINDVAEFLGIDRQQVKDLLAELRKAEPLLFPYEREYLEFGHYRLPTQKLSSQPTNFFDGLCEEDIRQKF